MSSCMTDSKWKERAVLLNLNSVNLDSVKLRFIKNDRFTDLVKQPFLMKYYRFALSASVQISALRYCPQVLLHIAGEDQVCVSQGIVIDQVVQLGAVSGAVAIQVFDLDAIEGERAAVGVAQLHAGGVHVVLAG